MKTLVVWLLMVMVLSVFPFESSRVVLPHADKLLHFIIYAITTPLFYSVLVNRPGVRSMPFSPLALSFVLAVSYGLLMEIAQLFAVSREFSLLDFLANAAGASAGALYVAGARRKTSGRA